MINYDNISSDYDVTRTATGLETIKKIIHNHSKEVSIPIDKIELISIGCGTGNNEIGLAGFVKNVYGIDISLGMINQAREKSKKFSNLRFDVGNATNLGFIQDKSYDVALFALSLHHMGSHNNQIQALGESYRILRTGGLVIIQTLSERQLRDGIWHDDLIPKATGKLIQMYVPIQSLIDNLRSTGFKYKKSIVPADVTIQGRAYFDLDGPFKKKWRSGMSNWVMATKNEVQQALKRLKKMKKDGTLQEYFERREAVRKELGQMTFVYAIK